MAELESASFKNTVKKAMITTFGLTSYLGLAYMIPDPVILGMFTTFSLSTVAGY